MLRPPLRNSELQRLELDAHGWLILFLTSCSIFGILLLSFDSLNVPLLLGVSLSFCILVNRVGGVSLNKESLGYSASFIVILILAVALRAEINPHLMGGQDQGLYTNYAEIMLKTGGLNFVDAFRTVVPGDLLALYDSTPMASVPLLNSEASLFTVAFYPLHPMWMAIFGWIFGSEYKTLSLLLFSVIYVWSGMLLSKEIFQSKRAGTLAAFLLATNPVLVFFSKFPVTEMVALSFSLTGFLFLIRGVREIGSTQKIVFLSLSVGCFVAFFFVRIQFLMYLPFFALVMSGALLYDRRAYWINGTIPTMLLICFLFGVSLVWYLVFQNHLTVSLFGDHISTLISTPLLIAGVLVGVFVGGAAYLVLRKEIGVNLIVCAINWGVSHAGRLFLLVLFISTLSLVKLYLSGDMPPFRWQLATNDHFLFRYHVLYKYIIFLSPFCFLALISRLVSESRNKNVEGLLFLFLTTSWLMVLTQPSVPYLYYYGRYLAGEILPYSLIAVSGIMAYWLDRGRRTLSFSLLLLTAFYYAFFLRPQIGFTEGERVGVYEDFLSRLHSNDIILAVGMDDRILVPLRLTYGRSVFALSKWNSSEQFITHGLPALRDVAIERGGRLILITDSESLSTIGNYIGGATFYETFLSNGEHVRAGVIQRGNPIKALALPYKHIERASVWSFYDLTQTDYSLIPYGGYCPDLIDFSARGNLITSGVELVYFSHQERYGRWTEGSTASIACVLKDSKDHKSIRIAARAFGVGGVSQKVGLSVNHGPIYEYVFEDGNEVTGVEIPLEPGIGKKMLLQLYLPDASSPLSKGISRDSRELGIFVESMSLK